MDECPRPRRPWLAAILSLLGGGPLGQVYVGRLRRSLVLWLCGGCLAPFFAIFISTLPIERRGINAIVLCVAAVPILFAVDAFVLARRDRHAELKRYQRWWVYVSFFVVFCLGNTAVAHLVRSFVAEAFVVPTRGMSPTILPGDRLLVDRLWYNRKRIHRSDVVVFRSEGPDSPLFIQRVVGLPGDEIKIRNEHIFINGRAWDDPHAVFNASLPPLDELANHGPVKVPLDCCFLLGDNRRLSKDSRLIGPIPLSDLYGVARWIYWSRERTFPNPHDTAHYVSGPILWERMGQRLD